MGKRPSLQNSVLLLLSVVLLSALGWTRMPQATTVTVKGRVTNGTPGGEVPPGLEVSLHVFSSGQESETLTTTVAADGSFSFEKVPGGEDRTYIAQVTYQGVEYTSDPVTPSADEEEVNAPITIYETTEDPATVQVTQLHVFINELEGQLLVEEYWLIGNEGERTYVGREDPETGQRVTLQVTLPEGAQDLTFDGPGLGDRFVERPNGFADTRPIPPGGTTVEIAFFYTLPYQEGLQVEQAADVPIGSVVVLMVQGDLALEGAGLEPMGTVDTQMGPAFSYIGGPLAAGEPLAFTLVPAPPTTEEPAPPAGHPATAPARNPARETAVGLAALAAAIVGALLLWRAPSPGPVPPRIRPLVERIAALDAEYRSGQIPEGTYLKRREQLKREIQALWEREGQNISGR
ncbi:MAG TPA: carboxypeptidase regulatory-like domain-containing protein [Chloroflexi bacterium]|nr:carboxypeptidase regulatory-like domain-containing protein [Chloroflexota bacterium]